MKSFITAMVLIFASAGGISMAALTSYDHTLTSHNHAHFAQNGVHAAQQATNSRLSCIEASHSACPHQRRNVGGDRSPSTTVMT